MSDRSMHNDLNCIWVKTKRPFPKWYSVQLALGTLKNVSKCSGTLTKYSLISVLLCPILSINLLNQTFGVLVQIT